jgi:hypothetical protein
MAFLEKADFNTVIRDYQLEAIIDGDDTIVATAIEIAIDEVTNIFTPNDMNTWKDGRPIYNIVAVFAQSGADRNAFILVHCKIITLWYLVLLCNTGLEYNEIKDRYDRSIQTLTDLARGKTNSGTIPKIDQPAPTDEVPWRSGSRRKFNHE